MREFTFILTGDEPASYRVEVGSLRRARELAREMLARSCDAASSIDILEGDTRLCTVTAAGAELTERPSRRA